MTDTSLKSVVSLDQETRAYKPIAHNLSPEAALEQVNNLQNDGNQAAILEQEGRHRTATAHKCKLCLSAAKSFTERQEAQPDDTEEVGATSAGEQNEED
jgi:hypothetical protein